MNRNFKRVLAGLAALTLCVGVVPHSMPSVVSNMAVVASAADLTDYTQIGDSDAYYKIDGDTLYVDGLEKNTEVPKSAFDSYNGIKLPETVTKVVIEENISSIGQYAFCYCNALTEVSMPNVTSIGSYAFKWCSFKSIDMPNVTSIGSCAFDVCEALTEVSMPNVTSIGSYAFRDTAITSVDLSSVTSIGGAAFSIFYGGSSVPNPNLVSVKFSETVPKGLQYAGFSSSTKLLIPADAYESYKQYEENGFTFCDYYGNALTIVIPEGYTRIQDSNAIYKIDGDTLYVDGLVENTNIPDAAFSSCDGGIVIPENVIKVEIGENITALDGYAFEGSEHIESVKMNNVSNIGSGAFVCCYNLKYVYAPSVEKFTKYTSAFNGCTSISEIQLGSSVPDEFVKNIPSTAKILIPADAYDNYKSFETNGYKFFDEATGKAISNMEFGDYVRGIGFTLDGKIGVNLQTTEKAEDFTVTCEGKTIPVIATKNGISFYIAPKEMVKEYTIEVNGTSKTITPVDIVTLYTADDAKPELAEYADLAQSLADYCKAADAYFDGDETTKIELPADYEEWKTEDFEDYKDKVSDDGNIYKTSLVLNSETAFKIYVSNPEGITVDEVNADEGVKTQIDKNTVCVKISNLGPVKAVNNSFTVNGGTFTVAGYLLKAFTQTDDEELVKLCSLYADYVSNACYWED